MLPRRNQPEAHAAANDLEAPLDRQPPSTVKPAATAADGDLGLAERPVRDTLIDALLCGEDPRPLGVAAERAVVDDRLAALGALTRSAGDEIGNHMAHFIDTTERFALVVEQFKELPEEISSVPVLLTEICERLALIATIGRDLARRDAQAGR
jgi:hypothetical protein